MRGGAQRTGLASAHVRELAIYEQRDARFTRHAPRHARDHRRSLDSDVDARARVHRERPAARFRGPPDSWTAQDLDCTIAVSRRSTRSGTDARPCCARRHGSATSPSTDGDGGDGRPVARTRRARRAPLLRMGRSRDRIDPASAHRRNRQLVAPRSRHSRARSSTTTSTRGTSAFGTRSHEATLCAPTTGSWPRIGVPQHDLAELLCFVLAAGATTAIVRHWIERHRVMPRTRDRHTHRPGDWQPGFRAALQDLMLNRLPMYALMHRIRPPVVPPARRHERGGDSTSWCEAL